MSQERSKDNLASHRVRSSESSYGLSLLGDRDGSHGQGPLHRHLSAPSEKDVEIAKDCLEMLNISHYGKRTFRAERRRKQLVLIAGLASNADVLIFDEPTQPRLQNQYAILQALHKLTREKDLTIITTTHHPEHALYISDKVLLMGEGRSIFGRVSDAFTEENLKHIYGMEMKVVSIPRR